MIIIRNKFVPFTGYKAINLWGILFVKNNAKIDDVTINHESIHSRQLVEVMIASVLISILFIIGGQWWIGALITLFSYYIWYVIEYMIRLIITGSQIEAYRGMSFEKEAYRNEGNMLYLNSRRLFTFLEHMK